ncbi:MAG TPA: hypothetical protein VF266_03765 [Thermoanaerobaculia bacterium]
MRTIILLLALSLSLFAFADDQGGVHVVPFGPTSRTPVDVHIPMICGVSGETVTRVGNVFKITLLDPNCAITIPIPYIHTVRLPMLDVGEYRVEVFLAGQDNVHGATGFVVRDAPSPQTPFTIHPFAVPVFGSDLRLRMTGVSCGGSCASMKIDVGGVQATDIEQTVDGAVWFRVPGERRQAGLVEVQVTAGDATSVHPGALYFFDDAERSVFERILFPVVFATDGANGSRWRSEATISNPRPWFVENANTLSPVRPCLTYPCGERLGPAELVTYGDGYPRGFVLHAPRPEAPDLAFALRVRDVSRQAEGLGTQIPVVREKDFTHGTGITLLDVPVDPRYRVKLRVYMIDPLPAYGQLAQISLRNTVTRATTLIRTFQLQPGGRNEPHYAEIDLPAGAANERVNVHVRMPLDATAWGFATVTNNATQQVTIVTPSGSGLQPCDTCIVYP